MKDSWWLGVAGGVAVGVGASFFWARSSAISPSSDENIPTDGPALYKRAKSLIPGGNESASTTITQGTL